LTDLIPGTAEIVISFRLEISSSVCMFDHIIILLLFVAINYVYGLLWKNVYSIANYD
jgi:hypothetical protein